MISADSFEYKMGEGGGGGGETDPACHLGTQCTPQAPACLALALAVEKLPGSGSGTSQSSCLTFSFHSLAIKQTNTSASCTHPAAGGRVLHARASNARKHAEGQAFQNWCKRTELSGWTEKQLHCVHEPVAPLSAVPSNPPYTCAKASRCKSSRLKIILRLHRTGLTLEHSTGPLRPLPFTADALSM